MPQAQNSGSSREEPRSESGEERDTEPRRGRAGRAGAWFAETAARTALALVGLLLLLFALGQAFGLDLLGTFADAVTSQTGRWLVVALFAVLIIVGAARWGVTRR